MQMFRAYDRFKATEAADYLGCFRAKHGKFGILWDSLSVHNSGPAKRCLESHEGEIFSRAYPVGWPKLNATEGIWTVARELGIVGHYDDPALHRAALTETLRTMHIHINVEECLYQKVSAITF